MLMKKENNYLKIGIVKKHGQKRSKWSGTFKSEIIPRRVTETFESGGVGVCEGRSFAR